MLVFASLYIIFFDRASRIDLNLLRRIRKLIYSRIWHIIIIREYTARALRGNREDIL